MTRWPVVALAVAAATAALPAPAVATWSGGAAGSAAAKALALPAGATPAATVAGRGVTVSWSATTIGAGAAPDGYVVKRYGADDQPRTVGAGCAGTVSATTCTESAVPAGTWRYTVAPKRGNWVGAESALSPVATVQAPTLSLTPSTVSSLPATLTGTLANFAGGASVTFRLDNASTGTVLAGSTTPSPLGADGSATVSVTLPSGTANGSHTIYAVDGQGSVASAVVDVAAVSCPTSAPAVNWLTGMEHGVSTTSNAIWHQSIGVGASVDSTVKRNGAYSLRMAPAAVAAYRARSPLGTAKDPMVVRFAMRFATLPVIDSDLAGFQDGITLSPPYFRLRYVAATGKLAIGFPDQTVASDTTVEAGRWYVIDMRFDPRTNPHTADWRIDGVPQTSTSYAQADSYASLAYWGSSTPATYNVNFDDFAMSQTAADYPIGDGAVLSLLPDGMGTNSGTAVVNNDLTALNATSWMRLDDVPMNTGTDGFKQTATASTSYGELTFQDTTETCIRAVGGRMTYDPLNTSTANNGKTTVVTGGVERTVHSGAMNAGTTTLQHAYGAITPTTAAWTPAAVNALRGRVGYSTDVTPQPSWQALMLEYDSPR